jgi:streptogrisin D
VRPTSFRRAATAVAVPAVLAAAVLSPSAAQAAPKPLRATDATKAVALSTELGTASAGAYLDSATGRMIVTVTTDAAARRAVAAGAVAKRVTHSAASLAAATNTIAATAKIPGTAWATDLATNQVVVTVDPTVTGTKLATVKAAVARAGSAARLETTAAKFSLKIAGGQAIYGGGYRCSLGFNVKTTSYYYFVTAGHCTDVVDTWYTNSAQSTLIGPTVVSSFPGNDYGIVRYDNSAIAHPGSVYTYSGSQTISSVGTAYVGESVSRSGSTSGVHTGTVTAINASVTYSEGTVSGLIRTNVCAESGDSGGSLYNGTIALGMTSGGSGDCTSGGVTYFQPLDEVFSTYAISMV